MPHTPTPKAPDRKKKINAKHNNNLLINVQPSAKENLGSASAHPAAAPAFGHKQQKWQKLSVRYTKCKL